MIKVCNTCGIEFKTIPARIKAGKGKFCSRRCYSVNQKVTMSGRNNPLWKGGKTERVCGICGRLFKSYSHKFCSVSCATTHSLTGLKGHKSHGWKEVKKIITKCLTCGKEFRVFPYFLKIGRGKFCSQKCTGEWKSKNLIGSKAPSWKGGITPIHTHIRNSNKYLQWRDQVFNRDNHTCFKCHNKGGYFHAHHIKRFSFILNDIKQKFPLLEVDFMAEDYPALWDIKNGITLCKNCHKIEHKKPEVKKP